MIMCFYISIFSFTCLSLFFCIFLRLEVSGFVFILVGGVIFIVFVFVFFVFTFILLFWF